MNKYDIVFVDIDDTLNPSNEPVSEYTKQVMKKLKENGIKVVVNTGRSATYAINKSKEANLCEYVISSNGSPDAIFTATRHPKEWAITCGLSTPNSRKTDFVQAA